MSDETLRAHYNKLLSELKYLESELVYRKSFVRDSEQSFAQQFEEEAKKMGVHEEIVEKRTPKPKKGPPPPKVKRKRKKSKKNKDLYKKIAAKTHPDKLLELSEEERQPKEAAFIEAGAAIEEDSGLLLRKIAQEVEVECPAITEEDLESFKKEVEGIRHRANEISASVLWSWASQTDKAAQKMIMHRYIKFLLTSDLK